jgi:predicted transposase YdaD
VILINIEAQGITNAGTLKYHLENRIVYYLSRMVSAQKNTEFFGEDYDSIKRVRSIWICMDAEQNGDSINELRLVGKNIYGKKENFENLDLMRAVVVSIRKSENVEESKNQLIAMLEELLSGKDTNVKKENLKNKYGMVMSVEMERRVSGMCNFSDVLVYDAEERGIERGRKEGEERGRREGMAKEIVEMGQEFKLDDAAILKRLQEKAGLTLEEATACLEKYGQVLT